MKIHKNKIILENCLGRVSEERIKFIEEKVGIQFPISFIELIRDCDGGAPLACDFEYFNTAFQEIWGGGVGVYLSLNPSEWSDFIKTWENPPEFFPKGLIAFAETGGGDYICFDYKEGKNNPNPPIVYWNHEANVGKEVSFVAKNFEEFLGILKEPEDE